MSDFDNLLENTRCASHCPPGWRHEVMKGVKRLSKYAIVDQVKSKFGGLRFYIQHEEGTPDDIREADHKIARETENACDKLCEKCGAERDTTYKHQPGTWIMGLCRTCRTFRK